LLVSCLISASSAINVDLDGSKYSVKIKSSGVKGDRELQIELFLSDIDTSDWETTGVNGVYIGLGFGSKVMAGTDTLVCLISYSGDMAFDQFNCYEGTNGYYSPPTFWANNGVSSYTTTSVTYENGKASYSVYLTRLQELDSKDYPSAFTIVEGEPIDIIWGYGETQSNVMKYHNSNRGST
jgi:hypothetical protein